MTKPPDATMDTVRHVAIQEYLDRIKRSSHTAINLGCGDHLREGYINCDWFNPNAEIQVDIRKISARIDRADLIEAHHALEHLSFNDSLAALEDWFRVLMPGGYLVISMPDFEACLELFLRSSEAERWNNAIKMIYGSQEHEGMFHKTAFTPDRLRVLLANSGIECRLLARGYPKRPTPSFLYVGQKRAL